MQKPTLFGREPALILGALQAALALIVAFGLSLSPEQVGVIMAFAAAVLAVVVRANVTPVEAPNVAAKPPEGDPDALNV